MLDVIGNQTLVADMSSNFLSQKVDIAKHGIIYAGA
jgi:phosphoserine aminotransferase